MLNCVLHLAILFIMLTKIKKVKNRSYKIIDNEKIILSNFIKQQSTDEINSYAFNLKQLGSEA